MGFIRRDEQPASTQLKPSAELDATWELAQKPATEQQLDGPATNQLETEHRREKLSPHELEFPEKGLSNAEDHY